MRHRHFKPLQASLRRVLVIQIDHHLGNTVLSLPIIQAMARYFTRGIDLLIDARYADLARRLEHVNRVIPYPAQRDGHGRRRKSFMQTARTGLRLFAARYQSVLDISSGIRSAPLTLLTASPRRFGYAYARRSWCFSHVIDIENLQTTEMHAFDVYTQMLQPIGQYDRPPLVRLLPDTSACTRVDRRLAEIWPGEATLETESPLVVLHPSAGIAWRRWPPERFAAVANGLIAQTNARILIVGVEGDRELAREIIQRVTDESRIHFAVWPLQDLIALFSRTSLLVSNESGPTHVAAAVGTPIVTIFGPTSEAQWRPIPIQSEQLIVLRGAQCDAQCKGRTCVAAQRCLSELSSKRVLQAALSQFDINEQPPSTLKVYQPQAALAVNGN